MAVTGLLVLKGSTRGSITYSPRSFSCSSQEEVTVTTVLPSSVRADESLVQLTDGLRVGALPVTAEVFEEQPDGTWRGVDRAAASLRCMSFFGQVVPEGRHTIELADSDGKVVANGTYFTTP